MPNLESYWWPMMSLVLAKVPGLKRQQTVSGMPQARSRTSIWVMSSRLMMAPAALAMRYSSSRVSLEENMMSRPRMPQRWLISTSGALAQSQPQPRECSRRRIAGVGVALTAKYSLNPGFQEKALYRSVTHFLMPASS